MELDVKILQKYDKRSHQWLLTKAQVAVNEFVRLRDRINEHTFKCISCGLVKDTYWMHCGHYLSMGQHSKVRFHEDNLNVQCSRCNTHLHGNQAKYRMGLVAKIGAERVERLEAIARQPQKWERFDLICIITEYRAKVKAMS